MSRDIRSFFQLKKPPKPKIEDDDDVIPDSPDVGLKVVKKPRHKKKIICDDSDEDETFVSKKKKIETSNKSKAKPNLKEVNAIDILGGSKVKRSEPHLKKEKKNTETGIHFDEGIDKILLELDEAEEASTSATDTSIISPKSEQHKPEESETKKTITGDKGSNENIEIKSENHKKASPKAEPGNSHNGDKKEKGNEKNKLKSQNHEESTSQTQSNHSGTKNERKYEKKSKLEQKMELLQKHKSVSADKNERKRDFSEFMENDTSLVEEEPPKTKPKHNKSLNESVLTDEERHERKMHSAALYQKYLNRSGPKHLGVKEMPEGAPTCLKDCAFLLTGVLDSFEREEIVEAITKYGGTVKSGISRKVTHVLAGEDAGPAKMAKAEELGIKIINEDQFLQLIKDLSNKNKTSKTDKEVKKEKEVKSSKKEPSKIKKEKSPQEKTKLNGSSSETTVKQQHSKTQNISIKVEEDSDNLSKDTKIKSETHKVKETSKCKKESMKHDVKTKSPKAEISSDNVSMKSELSETATQTALMWVDKYKPQSVKQIIGQHGDASNVKKLSNWLSKWYMNRKAKIPKPSPWAKNDDGGYYKAALLSGPPGVGKTTTVTLVCQELGFDAVELNASDSRNKALMKLQIGELLTTTSLAKYARGDTGKQAVSKKHVLVMDEVDGMAGNEDRGGLQELISLIKSSSVPIICTCNDRNSQKMRSLVNYCYDLRFAKPRVDQIKSAMLSICFKEGIKIPPDTLTQLIISANQDVRQTVNLLSMWAVEPRLADSDSLNRDVKTVRKDVKLGPWEAVRKVFSADEHRWMSITDKSDLFFYDYSLAPLFVQENYLSVTPHCPKTEFLQRFSKAADSISIGDMVDARIRRSQAWNLLPMQAMYSSVIPGAALSGHVSAQVQFPGWLGKNSRANKMHRMCQEIHAHTRLSTSGSKSSVFLDYAPHLRDAILLPLRHHHSDGVEQALSTLESYHLLRDDLDSLVELAAWPGQQNPMAMVDSKVKAAMTRAYNKKALSLPYAPSTVKRVKRDDNEYEDNEEEDQDPEVDSDPENDALIKKKKSKESEKSNTKEKASSSKEKSTSREKKKKK